MIWKDKVEFADERPMKCLRQYLDKRWFWKIIDRILAVDGRSYGKRDGDEDNK